MSGQIQYITVVDSKCCGGVPTTFEIPIGATPHEIATITGSSIERAIELWETRISERPDLCPIIYYNELISRELTKNNCPLGQSGTNVIVEIPEGMFSSQLSQKDANDKAELYFKEFGQKIANELGTCIIPDCGTCGEYRISKTVTCGEFRIKTECINGRCTDIGKEYFVCLTGNCNHTNCITPCVKCSQTCPNGDCDPGFTCNSGKCVPLCDNQPCSLSCLSGNCPTGQSCISGKCVENKTNICTTCGQSCLTGACQPGFICINGKCVADCNFRECSLTCLNGTCPSGQTCSSGKCVPIQSSSCVECRPTCPTGSCPSGFSCIQGTCVANCSSAPCSLTCLNGNCPTGETCNNGVCVPINQTTCLTCNLRCPTGSCQPGFKCVNGVCLVDCINADCSILCPSGNCPSGQNCVNGTCQNPPPPPPPPIVSTTSVINITTNSVTLRGQVNPNGFATTWIFEYSTNINFTSVQTTPTVSAGSGTLSQNVERNITGLSPSTTYYFRIVATNVNGQSVGNILTFTTETIPPPPPPKEKFNVYVIWDGNNLNSSPDLNDSSNFVNNTLFNLLNQIIDEEVNKQITVYYINIGSPNFTLTNSGKVITTSFFSTTGALPSRWLTYPSLINNDFSLSLSINARVIIFQERSSNIRRVGTSETFNVNTSFGDVYDNTGNLSGSVDNNILTSVSSQIVLSNNFNIDYYNYLIIRNTILSKVKSLKISLFTIPRLNDNTTESLQRQRHYKIANAVINKEDGQAPYLFDFGPIPNLNIPGPLNILNWNLVFSSSQQLTINNPAPTSELKSLLQSMIN